MISPATRCAIGGFLVHLVLGTLYCWGNITTAVTAHLRKYQPDLEYSDTIVVYCAALAFQGLFMFIGGIIEKKIGAKRTVFLGGYIIVIGTFLASTAKTVELLIFYHGVLFGIGMGIVYSTPVSCAIIWCPARKGLLSGIILAGFGGGAFVFGLIASSILDPAGASIKNGSDYFDSDSSVANNVPKMYVIFGLCFFVLITLGGSLIIDPETPVVITPLIVPNPLHMTDEKNEVIEVDLNLQIKSNVNTYQFIESSVEYNRCRTDSNKEDILTNNTQLLPNHGNKELTSCELIQSPLAWYLATCLVLVASPGMYIAGTYKVYGEALFHDEAFLSTIGSMSSIFNFLGRIGFGYLADKIGVLLTLKIVALLMCVFVGTYSIFSDFGKFTYALWTFIIFSCEGCNFSLFPSVNLFLFGKKYASANYGLIFIWFEFFCVLSILVLSKKKISFHFVCIILSIILLAGFLNLLIFHHLVKKKYNRNRNDAAIIKL